MAKMQADPEDPRELMVVAERLVEEYVRLGFSDQQLLSLFRNPFFAGTHALYRAKGEAWVKGIIAQVRERWGQPKFTMRSTIHEGTDERAP